MNIDPAATLRCWAIDVHVSDRRYTIPALPATAWLLTILDGSWMEIVPGLLVDSDQLRDDIVEGRVEYEECKQAAQAALCVAAGIRRWWSAATLCKAALSTWVGGELQLRGVDPDRVSLAAFLAAAYRAATANMDRSARQRFDVDLDRPPTGLPPEEWFDEDEAAVDFMALMHADAQAEAAWQEEEG